MTEELKTAKEVAAELGVTPRRVLALAKTRDAGRQLGTTWVFTPADVDKMRVRRTGRPPKEAQQ